jgi:hypothetical protein
MGGAEYGWGKLNFRHVDLFSDAMFETNKCSGYFIFAEVGRKVIHGRAGTRSGKSGL